MCCDSVQETIDFSAGGFRIIGFMETAISLGSNAPGIEVYTSVGDTIAYINRNSVRRYPLYMRIQPGARRAYFRDYIKLLLYFFPASGDLLTFIDVTYILDNLASHFLSPNRVRNHPIKVWVSRNGIEKLLIHVGKTEYVPSYISSGALALDCTIYPFRRFTTVDANGTFQQLENEYQRPERRNAYIDPTNIEEEFRSGQVALRIMYQQPQGRL